MTYDTAYLAADFIYQLKAFQLHAGHEPHALRLARHWRVRVRLGFMNRSRPDAPGGPQVMVQPWYFGNSDVLRHELAHIVLYWSGLEAEVIAEHGPELGWKVVESLCDQAVAFLRIPPPMVDEAVGRYGVSAQAVRHIQKLSGAGAEMALRRLVYDDPRGERAGFITSGLFIAEVVECNWQLPFGWLDEVPLPRRRFPEEARASFSTLPSGALLGVCCG